MATTVAELIATLGLDAASFHKELDNAENKGKGFGDSIKRLSTIGGGVLAAGFGAATVAVGVLASSIGPASDLTESINAVNVVFTDASDILHKYGETSAETVGLSTAKFNQLSSVTGAFLTNLGFDSQGAAQETINLTERAADMASVFNTDVSDALAAIQSGLKGEFNPLEQFGVKLNAATIEAKALEMGLADSKAELTDSMKAQAALSLIYEQTNKVAGDFLNTSDGLANQQRVLSGIVENLRAKLGAALLPALTSVGAQFLEIAKSPDFQQFLSSVIESVGNFSTFIVSNIPSWVQGFKSVFDWLSNNKAVVVGVFAALAAAALAWGITTAVAAVTAMAPFLPIIAVIAAIGIAVGLLYAAWQTNFGGIREKTAVVVDFIKKSFEGWKLLFTVIIPNAIQTLKSKWTNAFDNIRNAIQKVIDFVVRMRDNLLNISLPDWLTPGSPTPFEIGLWGIANALKAVNNVGFTPSLSDGLAFSQSGALQLEDGSASDKTVNYQVTINNPQGEPAETSLRSSLKKLSYLGVPS